MSADPIRAWTLPSAGSKNRVWRHCRRWHWHWRSRPFESDRRTNVDCARCGIRWVW